MFLSSSSRAERSCAGVLVSLVLVLLIWLSAALVISGMAVLVTVLIARLVVVMVLFLLVITVLLTVLEVGRREEEAGKGQGGRVAMNGMETGRET